jgi:hypothetical protein
MLFRFKITLLAAFILLTLTGLATHDLTLLGLGVMALGVSLGAAVLDFTFRDNRSGPETQFSP